MPSLSSNRFSTTHWNIVASAADSAHPDHEKSLEKLLLDYLPALKEFLVGRFSIDTYYAEDLLQAFLLEKVLKRQILAQADRARGRFRTFLLNALCNFVISEFRRASAQRRIPPQVLVPLENLQDRDFAFEMDERSAREFDLAFTRQILTETVRRFQAYCLNTGRMDIWEVFQARVLTPILEETPPVPYEELVSKLQLRSPDHASNILISGKRVFTRLMRGVVAEYAQTEEDIDEELAALRGILNGTG